MNQNLLEQYELVKKEITRYEKWAKHVSIKYSAKKFKYSAFLSLYFTKFWKWYSFTGFRRVPLDLELLKKAISPEEQKNSFYNIFTDNYPLDGLSRHLELQFPSVSFDKLVEIHKLQKKKIEAFNKVKPILGAVLAAFTFLLKNVPESIVKKFMDYEKFEFFTFYTMLALILYIGIILLPAWIKFVRERSLYSKVGESITYTAIRIGSNRVRRGVR